MPAPLTVRRLHTSELGPALKGDVLRLCRAAYRVPMESYFTTVGPGDHLLGYRDRDLVSHLMWVTRWLQPADRAPLRTAYIELVATHPGEERRGHATQLLTALVPYLADYDVAALSPATEHLYARLGWRFWRGPLFARKVGCLVPTPEERVMILRLDKTPTLDSSVPLSVEWRDGEVW